MVHWERSLVYTDTYNTVRDRLKCEFARCNKDTPVPPYDIVVFHREIRQRKANGQVLSPKTHIIMLILLAFKKTIQACLLPPTDLKRSLKEDGINVH